MKTQLIFVFFVLFSVFLFSNVVQIGAGLDSAGNHQVKTSYLGHSSTHDYDVSMGVSPYIEIMAQDDHLFYGIGVEYQAPRKVDFTTSDGKMGFVPVYGLMRVQIPLETFIIPEFIGQLGYNFLLADDDYKGNADVSGGIYWGFGAGLVIDKFVGQLMYKTNYGSMEQSGYKWTITNTQINLSAGIRF